MDAEFNMMNKHIDKRILAHVKKTEALKPNQYGSQKHHDSRKAVLDKVLLNDIV